MQNGNVEKDMQKDECIDLTFFSIDDMLSASIFELRDIAAFLGVKSPTTLSKIELVKASFKAKCNPKESCAGYRIDRGRPTKPAKSKYKIDWDKVPECVMSEMEISSALNKVSGKTGSMDRVSDVESVYDAGERKNYNQQRKVNLDEEIELGILEIMEDGYGFTRSKQGSAYDAYVGSKLIRALGLRKGDLLKGTVKNQFEGKQCAVDVVTRVNGMAVETIANRVKFDDLVPIYPDEMLRLEKPKTKNDISMRCIDFICPIGKGQRALIVAPPKAGKTTLIKKIASNIMNNDPNLMLFTLLIDERPEEVTDISRSVPGEVVYSTFDETAEHHIKVAEMLIERAKRNVEIGRNVVIIMDSLTRLARAYNSVTESSGKTLSGGIDPLALHFPKKFFGTARNIENGGSLTIIATALVETGSRMDDVIFEEFKGTGNLELHLDRKLSEKRIFPAIDLNKSSTRREDLLLSQKELEASFVLRRLLSQNEADATQNFLNLMISTKNNQELCEQLLLQFKSLDK